MKGYWKLIAGMALPLLRSAGEAKKQEDVTQLDAMTRRV